MKKFSQLLIFCVLTTLLLPMNYSFAIVDIDRESDGINIDDIVYHISQSDSSVDTNTIEYYMDRVAPINSIPTAADVAEGLPDIVAPDTNVTQLTLPDVPNGYAIAITQSSDSSVISLDGTIIPPPEITTVDLVLTVTRKYDNSSVDINRTVIVPKSSTLITGGTVSANASQNTGEGMENAFDGNVNTKWYVGNKPVEGWWIQYELTEPHIVTEYSVASANDVPGRDPKKWILMGSNDGFSWQGLDSRDNVSFGDRYQTNKYSFVNNTSYRFYKLDIFESLGNDEMQLSEVELFGTPAPAPVITFPSSDINVALSPDAIVEASSTMNLYPVSSINNGDRKGVGWGSVGGWNDDTDEEFPDWVQITFDGYKLIHEINVITVQDNFLYPIEPTIEMVFSNHGVTEYSVQYWFEGEDGADWATVPGGYVNDNNKVWRQFMFQPIYTNKIRLYIRNAVDNYSRLIELEAWTSSSEM